ncbi:acetyl-CoA carboxylase biotin carboxyl carrier protein [Microbacterium sp. NPDC077644]|uniref:acetyl-CoA carboxylase biotin carboxyl carrier protein n=1 Tax=Microbacterium sp. NPDC077644 TaxID=3155055 RepID=UPI00344E6AB2
MDVDLEELAAIIELLDKTEFTQFRFEKGELRIAVSRGEPLAGESASAPNPAAPTPAAPAPAATAPTTAVAPVPPAAQAPAADDLAADEFVVRSPMLGTFYSAPKPGEPSFVQEGQTVASDAVLCIIEVMKLMNSVPAGETGVVRRVLVRDGDLVEYDQPLFVLGRAS